MHSGDGNHFESYVNKILFHFLGGTNLRDASEWFSVFFSGSLRVWNWLPSFNIWVNDWWSFTLECSICISSRMVTQCLIWIWIDPILSISSTISGQKSQWAVRFESWRGLDGSWLEVKRFGEVCSSIAVSQSILSKEFFYIAAAGNSSHSIIAFQFPAFLGVVVGVPHLFALPRPASVRFMFGFTYPVLIYLIWSCSWIQPQLP